ncbi:MAG: DUF2512 family protein [Heliobacteriaceae bacterium]|nr:DUF2512 family protein [Heliobacteriaceae bacterium]
MNKTVVALMFKPLMFLVFAAVTVAYMNSSTWSWALAVTIVLTLLSYFVGDLLVLPAFGNTVTAGAEALVAAATAYILDLYFPGAQTSPVSLVFIAALTGIGEYYYHRYFLGLEKVAP